MEILNKKRNRSIEKVINLSRNAQKEWGAFSLKNRVSYFSKLRKVIREEKRKLIEAIKEDTQKDEGEILITELMSTDLFIGWHINNAEKILSPKRVRSPFWCFWKKSFVFFEPIGVVGIISPWNFPFHASIVPALGPLLAGNTVLLKPSEYSPRTTEVLKEMIQKTEFPPGVFEIVPGGPKEGEKIVRGVDGVFFTGGIKTGRKVARIAGERIIPFVLELGGNDGMLVLSDAPLERAVNAAIWGSLLAQGQLCISIERIFVAQEIYEDFLKNLIKKVKSKNWKIKIFEKQEKILKEHVKDAVSKGADLINKDYPLIIQGIEKGMKIFDEETFGPVIAIRKIKNEEEGIKLINSTSYGLSASVWSKNIKRAKRIARKIEAGSVMINDVVTFINNPYLPFGGIKKSGVGRYHSYFSFHNFCNIKAVMVDRGVFKKELYWHMDKNHFSGYLQVYEGISSKNILKLLKGIWQVFLT